MRKLSSLSIFFPVFNDARTIGNLVNDAYKYGRVCAHKLEVIVVNDGSTDESARILKNIKRKHLGLRIITHPKNRGYGAALTSGFKAAKKSWVFYTDSDGQYNMKDLPLLVSKVASNIGVVNGFKIQRSDNLLRTIGGSLYNKFLHAVYNIPITDVDCDFRLIKRAHLSGKLLSTSGAICTELVMSLQQAGATFTQIGVHHYPRKYGRSQFLTVKNLINTFKDHIELYKRFH